MKGMILHRGAVEVSRERLATVATPEGTESFRPIAHHALVEQVVDRFAGLGWTIEEEKHAVFRQGARYFGTFKLGGALAKQDYQMMIGLRNSHDMSHAAGIAVGASVFVCDNGSFSGEVTLFRKHTSRLFDDLPQVIAKAISKTKIMGEHQDKRFALYKGREITASEAHDLVIRALDRGVVPARFVPKVLKGYRHPRHEDFKPNTAWSLFNAFTETLKDASPIELPSRTMRLHNLMDEIAGVEKLAAAEPVEAVVTDA